jgi:hypothetical protein
MPAVHNKDNVSYYINYLTILYTLKITDEFLYIIGLSGYS